MTTQNDEVCKAMIDGAISSFRANKDWADKAIAQLSDDKLRISLDPNTNSIAVIMKHVAGNLLSRWTDFLTTDGEKPWRNRDDEFVDTFCTRDELIAHWDSGWQRLFDSLSSLSADDLAKTVMIRGEPHSVPLAIQRALAHCAYHVGQIMLIARILAGDHWTTITIPRGASANFNQQVRGEGTLPVRPTRADVTHKKPNLPSKSCPVCNRPFAWRKKWAKVWDQVRYCSEACRKKK